MRNVALLIVALLFIPGPLQAADALGLRIGAPEIGLLQAGSGGFTNHTLDGTGKKLGFVVQVGNGDAITALGFRYGARTGTPPTYKISVQGVSTTTGYPDGTIKGGGSPASKTFTPPADTTWNGTWREITLDNTYTPSRGETIAIVIEYSAGTCDGSNNSSFSRHASGGSTEWVSNRYYAVDTGSGWGTGTFSYFLPYTIVTANTVTGFPASDLGKSTSIGTNGHRQALRFKLPTSFGSTYKVRGVRLNATRPGPSASIILGLWNAAGTALNDVTIDTDQFGHSSGVGNNLYGFWDDAPATLDCGTEYYVGIERTGATTALLTCQLASANDLKAYPGGSEFYYASWNGSSWTADNTQRPYVELILDDVTAAAGGGGNPPSAVGVGATMRRPRPAIARATLAPERTWEGVDHDPRHSPFAILGALAP